jgi:HPt (histidine-containing phosphotransfer) domain-containing protein
MDARSAQEALDGSPAKTPDTLDLWLVNDDPAQLMVQKRLLSRVAKVSDFLSPLEALAAARLGESSPFLITDFHMPGMDGPELAGLWCELHRNARVLVISASEISRREQEKIDALPGASVRLLTSYRITDLQEQAKIWFEDGLGLSPKALPAATASSRFDRSALEKLSSLGGPAFLAKTIARFLHGGPEKVKAIVAAFARQDFVRMHEVSHALKGSCGLVGAVSLSQAADTIETATAEKGDRDNLEAQVRELTAECAATVADLEAFQL